MNAFCLTLFWCPWKRRSRGTGRRRPHKASPDRSSPLGMGWIARICKVQRLRGTEPGSSSFASSRLPVNLRPAGRALSAGHGLHRPILRNGRPPGIGRQFRGQPPHSSRRAPANRRRPAGRGTSAGRGVHRSISMRADCRGGFQTRPRRCRGLNPPLPIRWRNRPSPLDMGLIVTFSRPGIFSRGVAKGGWSALAAQRG